RRARVVADDGEVLSAAARRHTLEERRPAGAVHAVVGHNRRPDVDRIGDDRLYAGKGLVTVVDRHPLRPLVRPVALLRAAVRRDVAQRDLARRGAAVGGRQSSERSAQVTGVVLRLAVAQIDDEVLLAAADDGADVTRAAA